MRSFQGNATFSFNSNSSGAVAASSRIWGHGNLPFAIAEHCCDNRHEHCCDNNHVRSVGVAHLILCIVCGVFTFTALSFLAVIPPFCPGAVLVYRGITGPFTV